MKTEKVYIEYLVLQVQAGDSTALQLLLPLIRTKMHSYVRYLMPGDANAEDCVQDALMVVTRKLSQVKDVKAVHGWVYQVINTRCHDYWRRSHVNNEILTDDVNESCELDLLFDDTHSNDQSMDISNVMARLPRIHQSVIFLFYFEGFTVCEMAAILEKPAGTIKSLLFDARAAIKSFLNQE